MSIVLALHSFLKDNCLALFNIRLFSITWLLQVQLPKAGWLITLHKVKQMIWSPLNSIPERIFKMKLTLWLPNLTKSKFRPNFILWNFVKQIALWSTVRELSFEWSHHRIWSAESKVIVILQNSIMHSGSEGVKNRWTKISHPNSKSKRSDFFVCLLACLIISHFVHKAPK